MEFTVKLAEKLISMNCIHSELTTFFKDYLVDDQNSDISLTWTDSDILAEQDMTEETEYSLPYLETLTALRKIAEVFPLYNRFLMHGASIAYAEKGYLFTAPSGTGKTTHIRLWNQYLNNVKIINGDKPFLSLEKEPYIYGSPWAGKEGWQKNHSFPLAGICFVQRGTRNKIRRLHSSECLALLFNQIYIPVEPVGAGKTLELVDTLLQKVPVWLLECDISEDAVRCSFETMTGLTYSEHKRH